MIDKPLSVVNIYQHTWLGKFDRWWFITSKKKQMKQMKMKKNLIYDHKFKDDLINNYGLKPNCPTENDPLFQTHFTLHFDKFEIEN